MAITYRKLFQPVQLGVALATIFTVDSSPTNVLLRGGRVRLTNTSASAVSVELDAVPSGGTAGVGNQLVSTNYTVPANGWVDVDLPVMAASDFLQGKAGVANVITVHFMNGGLFS
ncbi:hypothetical protein [Ralstonia chuxiongensis]|uniref:Uncharacterized protein n=1 Tax=Ralstonia chuxiongensis TaxID=2957504 RepID=A0AA41WSP0_9RALS|nr:hypothetical protein [Ralstonia chuxiongensis]MCP1173796.1 hypothetical protein [Ralstonia chuxiongensis]